MTRVILFGICGKMGRIVAEELSHSPDISLVAGVEQPDHPCVGEIVEEAPVVADGDQLPENDVWLDFSLAGPAIFHARLAGAIGKPFVMAATGFNATEEEELEWQAKRCALLIAPNLSAGVGALENLATQSARLLTEGFDAVVSEVHHKTKKDAPSGTAKRIAEKMAKYGPKPQINFIRAGGAVGEHRIHLIGAEEELILIHRAWSRRAFSSGVPRAIRFIVRQPAGLYTLQDIFGRD